MKDAFDVLMITHAGLCKGYADALKLILDIDEDDFATVYLKPTPWRKFSTSLLKAAPPIITS